MPLSLRWAYESDYDRVALTRLRCYSGAAGRTDKYQASVRNDPRQKPGDFLLAERDGEAVGTSTALSLTMNLRGARLPCQGVAYVGTIKTARRIGSKDEPGVASQLMHATLNRARERGEVLSALMPFRASYYEHFGYGNAEHRTEWTIPIGLLPRDDFAGFRFVDPNVDLPVLLETRQREQAQGHCDVETDLPTLKFWSTQWPDGTTVVDQPDRTGPARSWAFLLEHRDPPAAVLEVNDWCADSFASFRRLLAMLGSLKDQYSFVRITTPGDWPINRLLRESQIPHRQVDHPVPVARPYTRMQVRILDHKRFVEAVTLPTTVQGTVTLSIKETEGSITRLKLDLNNGRVTTCAGATDSGAIELTDVLWSSIATGDIRATVAHRLGLIRASDPSKLSLLDAFADGPAPFCQEYF
ncbi:MAG: GNAT family N-acetyltransferase [Tepidisphaeraceae bacterium]